MDTRTTDILLAMRNYLLLEPNELSNFIIAYKIPSDFAEIVSKFMLAKWYFFKITSKFNFQNISLGRNCFPHTESIWNGLKLPNYTYNRGRLFFDMCVSNSKTAFEILSERAHGPFCDSIKTVNNRKMFISLKYDLRYNHDFVDEGLSDSQNIKNFNIELERRIADFSSFKQCPCLYFYDAHDESYIDEIYDYISSNNSRSKLIVTSINDLPSIDTNKIFYIKRTLPYEDYIWHLKSHNLTEIGFEYEHRISTLIVEFIKDNFEENKNYVPQYEYALAQSKTLGMEIFSRNISKFL